MKVSELLDSPEKWTKTAPARDVFQCRVGPLSAGACCWCLLGAVEKCYPGDNDEQIDLLRKAIQKLFCLRSNAFGYVSHFNDHPDTTFADVQAVIKEANV